MGHAVSPTTRNIFTCALCTLLCLFASVTASAAPEDAQQKWVPGEYIVKYNEEKLQQLRIALPGIKDYSDDELKNALTATLEATPAQNLPLVDAQHVKANTGDDINVDAAVDLLDSQLADFISPNFLHSVNTTPNDPSYSSLWGMNQSNDIDIDAPEAWEATAGDVANDIVVGIVDTGVDYNHPDLAANIWTNPAEANGKPGVDDDGNGIVDDIHGFNAVAKNGNPMDDNRHGTHVAGTIAAVMNNGIGVAGVAPRVKVMPLKFLSASGQGSDVDAIAAITYAINMRNVGGRLKVLSNSWGGGGFDQALLNAITAANDAGILFVAAAGNDGKNTDQSANYPSNYEVPNVISVAALDNSGMLASFSNYGATSVDVAAPGVGIYSTVPNNGYDTLSGTSMATPHVSGIAALIYSRYPQFSPAEVKSQILSNVKQLPTQSSLEAKMVKPGIADAKKALADPDNFPPDLEPLQDVLVNPSTRLKTVPLLASDRENDPLAFSARVLLQSAAQTAAALDAQYDLTAYAPQYDNYYGLGEKVLTSSSGKTYLIFSDGTFYELQYPYYYYRGAVDSKYYSDPVSLANASNGASAIASVTIIPGTPNELRIEAAAGTTGSFGVSVTVTDGNRSDTESFTATVKKADSCS